MAAVGHGIAEAFLSTVYGLALANFVFLPIAGKLRAAAAQWIETQELLTDGVVCVIDRLHPLTVETKLGPLDAPLCGPADALVFFIRSSVCFGLSQHKHSKPAALSHPETSAKAPQESQNQDLTEISRLLNRDLERAIDSGEIEVTMEKRGLVLELKDASFFRSGDHQLRPEAYATIGDIARAILPGKI